VLSSATGKYDRLKKEETAPPIVQLLGCCQQPTAIRSSPPMTAQAGPGHLVFVVGVREAALALPVKFVPVDHAIVGIVDQVDTVSINTTSPGT
jgi:ethanolamine utilization protein EutN